MLTPRAREKEINRETDRQTEEERESKQGGEKDQQ